MAITQNGASTSSGHSSVSSFTDTALAIGGTSQSNALVFASICFVSTTTTPNEILSITDTNGNTWQRVAEMHDGGGWDTSQTVHGAQKGFTLELWYTKGATIGTTFTPTVTFDGTVDTCAACYSGKFLGYDATEPFDQNASLPSKTKTTTSSNPSLTISTDTANVMGVWSMGIWGTDLGVTTVFFDGVSRFDDETKQQNNSEFTKGQFANGTPITGGYSSDTWTAPQACRNRFLIGVVLTADAQSVAVTGTFDTTEEPDVFLAQSGYQGTFDTTEAPDVFAGNLFGAITGDWASTEAPDGWSATPYTRLDFENPRAAGTSFLYDTNGPNRIVCVISANVAVTTDGNLVDPITSVTGSGTVGSAMTFQRADVMIGGPDDDSDMVRTEMWWAYAPSRIVNETFNITYGSGLATTHVATVLAIKGLNGNYTNPFDDNPYAHGSGQGAMDDINSPTAPVSSTPVATGPLSASGGIYVTPAFDPATGLGVTLGSGDLVVNSIGSFGGKNWVTFNLADAKQKGMVYFETEFTHIAGPVYGVGALYVGSAYDAVGLIGSGLGGIVLRGDGTIWANGSQRASLGAPADGDIMGTVLDFDNAKAYFRNVTQTGLWNNNPNADPVFRTNGIDMGEVQIVQDPGGGHTVVSIQGPVLPYSLPDGVSSSAEQRFNFGSMPFEDQPLGIEGWGVLVPAEPPTHVHSPGVVLGWQVSATPTLPAALATPPGYTTLRYDSLGGAQRHLSLNVYGQVLRDTNIILPDNDFQQSGTAVPHWVMMFDAFKVAATDPGSWESTEAGDTTFIVGSVGGAGIRIGFWTSTEAKDIFAAVGGQAVSGVWNSTEAKDIFSAYITQPLTGTWDSTEAPDIFAGTGIGMGVDGIWASTEEVDILTISGIVPIAGTFDTSETADRFRAIGAGVTQQHRRRRGFVS